MSRGSSATPPHAPDLPGRDPRSPARAASSSCRAAISSSGRAGMHSSRQTRVPISQGSKYSKHRKKGPAGMPGLSLCWMFISNSFKTDIGWTALAPVSFVPDVAAALSAPLTLHPDRAGMWGTHIVATNPDVAAAVPAVVAADPDPIVVRAGRGGNYFYGTRWGRSNADDNLSIRGTRRGQDSSGAESKLCFRFIQTPLLLGSVNASFARKGCGLVN